ncbi:MAG: hypothetical protein M1840_002487 [Geoglossum simile]|nr:MAG: hypothetical protein M1840_002487 [Geoglossum simile]
MQHHADNAAEPRHANLSPLTKSRLYQFPLPQHLDLKDNTDSIYRNQKAVKTCFSVSPSELMSPLKGYENVTTQCQHCGNYTAHCVKRW